MLLLVSCALVGCAVPSKAIRQNYTTYNQTIQFNESQQMLLNLVRLKYRETPLFLKVGAVSTSYDFRTDGDLNLGRGGTTNAIGVGVGASWSERPTVTYTPIEGNTFVKQVLAEVDRDTFVLLLRAGWPIDRLCNVLVERIGDDINNLGEPSYARFKALVDTLDEAQGRGGLRFVTADEKLYLRVMTDRVELLSSARSAEMREVLIPFEDFQLRSFLDIMFYLSKNTDVPPPHADQVKASEPNGWIHIRWTADRPDDAVTWVQYQGYFFSIAANDIKSKDTFALLKLLFQVQAGDIKTVQPVLTLPVAQP